MTSRTVRLIPIALAGLLAGCASTPGPDPEVEAARTQYQTARANSDAQKFASKELERAEHMLASADAALEARHDDATVDHLAYLSNQSSRTAVAVGEAKAADERVAGAAAERERIRLVARTREAESARTQAEDAREQAEIATHEAQTANSELAKVRDEAARLGQINAALEAMNAEQSERGLIVTLGDMLFDTGKAELKTGAGRDLDNIAEYLRANPDRPALIEGFTDSVGSEDYNQALSDRRASAVRQALVDRGVDGARVVSRGYGESFPVGTNDDAGGRQLNRRVEVIVSNDTTAVKPRG